jgi:ABC-2 type transport system permease protein
MRLTDTPFAAVFRNEVLLASKRAAPYVLAPLFAGNALLWWGWGAATHYGWETNGDFTLAHLYNGFTFLTLPLFTALVMGDPVARDFRAGVAPLVLSKPVGRAEYLLGKFCGNFFVLVCCQAAFALTLCLLQAFRTEGMVTGPTRVLPYLTHFLMIVVVSHLLLGAVFFAAGTLSQSAKLVYVVAVAFYPLFAAYQFAFLRALPADWRVRLDPLLSNRLNVLAPKRWDAAVVNQLVVDYPPDLLLNRALTVLAAAACLWLVYARFGRIGREVSGAGVQTLGLGSGAERLYNDAAAADDSGRAGAETRARALPAVSVAGRGLVEEVRKLWAAVVMEFRLLAAERGLVVVLPLAAFASVLEVVFYEVRPEVSYSGAYASRTCAGLMLFVCGLVVFYTGEALHRDRELRVEPVLWAAPAPDYALLLSKFCATLVVAFALVAFVGLTAAAAQLARGHTPVEPAAYLLVYGLVLLPTAVFVAGAATALGVLLRDKYVAHAACVAAGLGLVYLYGMGYRHPLYNPALYGLWTYAELRAPPAWLVLHRVGCVAAAGALLALALAAFPRKGRLKALGS